MAASRVNLGTIRNLARLVRVSPKNKTGGKILLQRCSGSATMSSKAMFSNRVFNKTILTSQIKSRTQIQFLSPICLQVIAGLGNTSLIACNHDYQSGIYIEGGESEDEGQQIP